MKYRLTKIVVSISLVLFSILKSILENVILLLDSSSFSTFIVYKQELKKGKVPSTNEREK